MWELIFLIYIILSLSFTASISLQLKDKDGVQNVSYYNNILLLVTVALLSMLVTFYLTAKEVCGARAYGNYSKNAIIALIAFSLFMLVLAIAMTSSSQFKNCPAGAKRAIITNLVLNVIFILTGFGYFAKTNLRYIK